jgi:hypothetical protein
MKNIESDLLPASQLSDLKVLVEFVHLYCAIKHTERARQPVTLHPELDLLFSKKTVLCDECSELLSYGVQKREKCPLEPKPTCKNCHIHCYSSEYRAKIRKIMAFSGRRMVLKGRLDYLWHYFFR